MELGSVGHGPAVAISDLLFLFLSFPFWDGIQGLVHAGQASTNTEVHLQA
jgi:hypothetical protein